MARLAHQEILDRFDTSRVLPGFLELLARVVGQTHPAPASLRPRA
jgi:hypothetical protein